MLLRLGEAASDLKKKWNQYSKSSKQLSLDISKKQEDLRLLKEELEDFEAEDTGGQDGNSKLEEELEEEERHLEELKKNLVEVEKKLEEGLPDIERLESKVEEESERNNKIIEDLEKAEKELSTAIQRKSSYEGKVEKAKKKLAQRKLDLDKIAEETEESKREVAKFVRQAKLLTWKTLRAAKAKEDREREPGSDNEDNEDNKDEDVDDDDDNIDATEEELEALERPRVTKTQSYYEARKKKYEADLEKECKRRRVSESDPKAVWDKLSRARAHLHSQTKGINTIEANVQSLVEDLRSRRRKWKTFRSHIARMTNTTFGEMLNKKGSSGEVEFDHKKKQLTLTVQKDTNEASQVSDVKALSGGERSFTTLSLLLALGENLETPFRVMDEFDVFMDSVARKIALETLVKCASAMLHRQFIFITPQDVSTLTPGPQLKIIKMRPPERSGQQTID